ncbi:MAG: hypothetical protein M3Z46_00895 [Actinomycetota bacterium]|nr:hypothetical protein [Actinomycetota bacterium]
MRVGGQDRLRGAELNQDPFGLLDELPTDRRQRDATSNALDNAFEVAAMQLLAIPQLAYDIPGEPPSMNGGDSDTVLLLLRRVDGRFRPWQTLPAPGGEDAEHLVIGDRHFLAVASLRTGSGPYDFSAESQIWTWQDGRFVPFQSIPTYAAKQFRHWRIGDRDFLGLAQGIRPPGTEGPNRDSVVFEWDGSAFVEHQRIPSQWAYNWYPFSVDDTFFVAHAEHLDASVLYRWDGECLTPHQALLENGGRAFVDFEVDGVFHLLVAGLLEPPRLMRWDGDRFTVAQTLKGLGARELTVLSVDGQLVVIRINFILGTPTDPTPVLASQMYIWDAGALREAGSFETSGGTDVTAVVDDDEVQILVSNSLSAQVRFATDTIVYSLSVKTP